MAWPSVSLTSLKRSMSSSTMATPPLSLRAVAARVRKRIRFGQPGQHVVGGLVRLAVDLVAQLLDEPGPLEAGAGVGDEGLEQPEVVLVEAVQLLVAIDGDDGADRGVPVHERGHDGVAVLAGDRIDGHCAVLGGEWWSEASPVAMVCVTIDASSRVIGSMPGGPVVVEGDPAGDPRRLGQDQLGPTGPHDRADLPQDVHAHGRRLEARRTHGPTEVVEVLQGREAEREAGVAPVGHDDQRGHDERGAASSRGRTRRRRGTRRRGRCSPPSASP